MINGSNRKRVRSEAWNRLEEVNIYVCGEDWNKSRLRELKWEGMRLIVALESDVECTVAVERLSL